MIVLAVDSTGPVASVAVSKDGVVLYEASANAGLTHSATIQPMIDTACKMAGVVPKDIDLYACVAGPGSFTGVRIGVCAVKGMATVHQKPCAELNALEVLAMGKYGFEGTICPILDARRNQVYAAAFDFSSGERPKRLMDDRALPLTEYMDSLPSGRLVFVGDGVRVNGPAIRERLGARAVICPDYASQLRAGAACRLAEFETPKSFMALNPIYLRKPQAQRERESGLSNG